MTPLLSHVQSVSDSLFGDLAEAREPRDLSASMPVSCTPAAVAAGATVTAAAFGAGFAVGYFNAD